MANTTAQRASKLHDEAIHAIRRVETLSGLLLVVGQRDDEIQISPILVGDVGGMIETETLRLRELFEEMRLLVALASRKAGA